MAIRFAARSACRCCFGLKPGPRRSHAAGRRPAGRRASSIRASEAVALTLRGQRLPRARALPAQLDLAARHPGNSIADRNRNERGVQGRRRLERELRRLRIEPERHGYGGICRLVVCRRVFAPHPRRRHSPGSGTDTSASAAMSAPGSSGVRAIAALRLGRSGTGLPRSVRGLLRMGLTQASVEVIEVAPAGPPATSSPTAPGAVLSTRTADLESPHRQLSAHPLPRAAQVRAFAQPPRVEGDLPQDH